MQNMKNIIVGCMLFCLPCLGLAQQPDEKVILNILHEQTLSWNRGDIETFMKGYWNHDSLMFIGKSGVTYGYLNTMNNYKRNYSDTTKMGKLFFDILQVKRLSPDHYFVVGKWTLKRTIGDLGGHYTLVFRRINNQWVIVSDHSS
jgi:hypothetical protein